MFQFPAFALSTLCIRVGVTGVFHPGRVSAFRNLRIDARLPASRSLSQATTSFVASRCQDIHHTPLLSLATFTDHRLRLPHTDPPTRKHPALGTGPRTPQDPENLRPKTAGNLEEGKEREGRPGRACRAAVNHRGGVSIATPTLTGR